MSSIAGAGYGAAKALEEILGEQMLRATMAQRAREAAERMQLERDRFAESRRQADIDGQQRQQQLDMQAGDRRERRNITGVRRMLGDAIMQTEGGITPDIRKGMAALQVESGDAPTLLNEPPVKRHQVTVKGPNGPITKLVTEDELAQGVEEYREPKTGPQPDYEWVMRGGQPMQIRKGTAQPGDRPYDAVSNRQQDKKPHPQLAEYSKGLIRKIDDLIGRADDPATPADETKPNRITQSTAGVGGAIRRYAPWNNSAKDVDAELFSLTSELAISALQKMRASSQTGGGVGNVALGEMEIMRNAEAAIRSNQSPQNLRRQLGIIRESEQRYLEAIEREERENDPALNRGITAQPIPGVPQDDVDAEIARLRAARKPKG